MRKELPPTNLGFEELRALGRLDEDVQRDVHDLLKAFEFAHRHPKGIVAGLKAAADWRAGERGWSFQTLRRLYYAFADSGDWLELVPKHLRERTRAVTLPEAFVEWWRAQCERNQRKCAPAYRKLIALWRAGALIPGYGTWREYWSAQGRVFGPDSQCPPDLPEGWSKGNLYRYVSDPAHLALARRGIAAALAHMPPIVGTREGLRPLEWVAFDDWESDFLVVVPGVEVPCKLRGLVCKDVATDMWLRFVLRPAVPREDDKEDGIKRRDMKLLVSDLLRNFGYPTDYAMNLVIERGTATLDTGDIAALEELSGGMIKVRLTQMISGCVLLGGFADRAAGNPRGKSWIESGFNLLHNEAGDLAGQKGRRYDLAPAELEARKKHARELLRAGRDLPPSLRAQLRLPFQSLDEARAAWERIMIAVNCVERHDCEGFAEVVKWRFYEGDQWQEWEKLLDHPPETRDRVQVWRRKETRMERWARLMQGVSLVKMPAEVAWRFMDAHQQVTVKNYRIEFHHEGRDLVFFAPDSPLLVEGASYLAYFDARDPKEIFLTNGKGAFRGTLPRARGIRRDDLELLKTAIEDRRHMLNLKLAEVNQRRRGDIEQTIDDAERNLETLQNADAVAIARADFAPAATSAVPAVAADLNVAVSRRAAEDERRAAIRETDIDAELRLERARIEREQQQGNPA